MYRVGLTGGIGSGKSTVAAQFRKRGILVVDADDVARQVVEPGTSALKEIAAHFGSEVLQEDGSLDRARLRQLVFTDENERRWLEQLLHPLIRQEIAAQLDQAGSAYAMLVSPLLLESGQSALVNRVLVIDVPEEVQIERTMKRDANTRDQVERIIAAQMPRQARLAAADDVLDNAASQQATEAAVEALHRQYLKLAAAG